MLARPQVFSSPSSAPPLGAAEGTLGTAERTALASGLSVTRLVGFIFMQMKGSSSDETDITRFGPRRCVLRHRGLGRNGQPDRHVSVHTDVSGWCNRRADFCYPEW